MAGIRQQAAAAGPWPPGSDTVSEKEQRVLEFLRTDKGHIARMNRLERRVHARAANRDVESLIYRLKKNERTGCARVDIRKEELVEVVFNEIGDTRAGLLEALAGTGKSSKGEADQLTRYHGVLLNKAQAKQRVIQNLGFAPDAIPLTFFSLPVLL